MTDVATAAGHIARFLIRFGLGLLGAACIVAAAAGVDWRLGLLAAGTFLLVLDWRMP